MNQMREGSVEGEDSQEKSKSIQLASLIPERSPFYDMIRGYFDPKEIALKVMPCLWTYGSNKH